LRAGLKLKARDAKENPAKVLAVVLFIMFIISGLLLLLLALLLYRLELSEAVVKVAVIIIYIVTGMSGGILMGKKIKDKKFLWGFLAGTVYFGILFAVSLAVKGGTGIEPVKMVTTWVLCACAGTAGGMIS
jgi:putative membrane protein (TIGR04086 family)